MLDIAIIGGGPAGLTAGLYAMRGGADAALFEALFAGGQATRTHRIDNYPGFADGVEGFRLGEEIARQAARFGNPVLTMGGDDRQIHLGAGLLILGAG